MRSSEQRPQSTTIGFVTLATFIGLFLFGPTVFAIIAAIF